jgi:hypothetical protein
MLPSDISDMTAACIDVFMDVTSSNDTYIIGSNMIWSPKPFIYIN